MRIALLVAVLAFGCGNKAKPADTPPPTPTAETPATPAQTGTGTATAQAECDAKECGPKLGMPNKQCPDGKPMAGPPGKCLRHDDGKCGWEVISGPN